MLDGTRVLDLSRLLPGPACTWFLQCMGAQVDRVEPLRGDTARFFPPLIDGVGAYFTALSRGKRSLALDLRHPEGITTILRLLEGYDVLVEGFKPGVMEKMGLDPEALRKAYPRLIIARLSGFGQTGPWAHRVGHDINYIGLAGVLGAQGVGIEGHHLPAVQIADLGGALSAATSICGALVAQARKGEGRILDISLTEGAMALYAPMLVGLDAEQRAAKPGNEMFTGGASMYGTYRCSDDQWVAVGALEPKFQAEVMALSGGLDRDSLTALFESKPRDHWVEVLAGACVTPVLTVQEVAMHPQIRARRCFEGGQVHPPVGRSVGPVPGLGEHTHVILAAQGFSPAEIQRLLEERVCV